jgi:Na+/proline symporter
MHSGILLSIILAYFALLLGIAFYTSRGSTNESFFIGNRSSKWWLVAFGMIGTSLSGMTFISVPGTVGLGGLGYYQVVIGYFIGYFAVAYVLLPLYYRLGLTSIYSYLETRFGVTAYKTGALFFILSRTLGATLRLYLVIKVLQKFILADMGVPFEATSLIILILILLYTYRGGVKTIVWTDTLQTTFMLLALVTCVWYLLHALNLSVGSAWSTMSSQGLTKLFEMDPMAGGFFLKQILGGAAITIAMTGLDQEMMQKNISVRTLGDSQKNVIVLSALQAVVVFLFLLLGGLLTLFAKSKGLPLSAGDDLFPTFAMQYAPYAISVCFLIGLISALFPSADGALTALTSSFCIDILGINRKPANRAVWDENKKKRVRLSVHYAFALVFLMCVFVFRVVDNGSLIDTLLKIAGYTYGPLLALFAFGILTKRNPIETALPVVCLAAPVLTYLLKGNDKSLLGGYIIGTELLLINAALTFIGLLLFSRRSPQTKLV